MAVVERIIKLQEAVMRFIVLCFSLLAFWSNQCLGQTTSRDALVQSVVAAYFNNFTDIPAVEAEVRAAQAANPGAKPEQINAYRNALGAEFGRILFAERKEAMVELQRIFGGLSDAELQKIQIIVKDPVYAKYQNAMLDPSTSMLLISELPMVQNRLKTLVPKLMLQNALRTR